MPVYTLQAITLHGDVIPVTDFGEANTAAHIVKFVEMWRKGWECARAIQELDSDRESHTIVAFVLWDGDRHVQTFKGTTPAN